MVLLTKVRFAKDDEEEVNGWYAKIAFALTKENELDENSETPMLLKETARVAFHRLPRAVNETLAEGFELCRLEIVKFCEAEVQSSLRDGRTAGGIVLPGAHMIRPPTIGDN